jgi:hypothetical protein
LSRSQRNTGGASSVNVIVINYRSNLH